MDPVIRNFFKCFCRFKMAGIFNVFGLSVAFASFMIIMIQVDFDRNFDRFHEHSDHIFRLELGYGDQIQAVISRPLAEAFFASSPAIVVGTLMNPWERDAFFFVENEDGERHHFEEQTRVVTRSFASVFAFDFVEGDSGALRRPDNVIIPQSMARRLFGSEIAVGKQLTGEGQTLTIGGVYRDMPGNTLLQNVMYVPMSDNENKTSWGNSNYHVYIRVSDVSAVDGLWENFKRTFDAKTAFGEKFSYEESGAFMRLTALPDVHYITDVQFDGTPKAGKQTVAIITAIALVIILIAGINFTNFSTALTPMRIKSINTQKVLGARVSTIRMAIVSEAVMICAVSFVIALGLMFAFRITPLAAYVNGNLNALSHPAITGGTALLALFVGIFAGLYPAWYITSFTPALVLKGSFGLSPKGRRLRSALIGIQFIASLALITGATFMFLQNRYMQRSQLGYNKDALLTVNVRQVIDHRDAITDNLRAFAGIDAVTFAEQVLSSQDQYMGWGRTYQSKQINFQVIPVHYTFLEAMNITVTDGRGFRREDADTQHGAYVFNETARRLYELELNTSIDGSGEIIGFMHDVKFASFRTAIVPMAFYVWGSSNWGSQPNNMYVRVKAGADMRAAVDHIQSTLAAFNVDYPFNIRYYDEVLQRLYEKETSLGALITLFSTIAILISIVGVFGLVIFDSECRRKEISIRKIMGASTLNIIAMFNRTYLRILVVCFVIATPLAWYAISSWLENFAYKTPMYWWVYALAFIVITVVTSATVTFQNWRVARDNPINAIRG